LICTIAVVIAISSTFAVSARPVTLESLKALSYGPADMLPSDESLDYISNGVGMSIEDGGGGGFLIPVHVPHGSYIKSVQLYAFDQNGFADVCADLYRNQFAQFTNAHMGGAACLDPVVLKLCRPGRSDLNSSPNIMRRISGWISRA
jgi:hypothetical protein